MRFRIYRSSDYGYFYEAPPCKNAVVVEEQEPIFEWARDENNKRIRCDTGKAKIVKHWEVDINTLEELLELEAEAEHPLIISSGDLLEIEIYTTIENKMEE